MKLILKHRCDIISHMEVCLWQFGNKLQYDILYKTQSNSTKSVNIIVMYGGRSEKLGTIYILYPIVYPLETADGGNRNDIILVEDLIFQPSIPTFI